MNTRFSEYPLCGHTKTNGLRCQSPAVTASAFCYHHQKLHRARRPAGAGPGFSTNVIYSLRNARSMQQALAMLVSGMATNRIHPKIAGRMAYTLANAAANLRRPQ